MEKLYRKGEIRMSNHGGGGNCGCCCSYQAESFNTAGQYGLNNNATGGDCGASCINGNSANMNANLATAISRTLPDG